ncbi:hypothetical protein [Streptomyces prasinopilosus]|uniref:Uncharacterized protein n=1 Tax=Streptomyces prasinopilosus TaxID=67344 RepID=A0A1G6WDY3_9ACTN|nr:hypothetical protein [Streptomyces prasinopilosus]SDD63999.1 hypothetical protein SAMN05216505_11046 [Streptomyces prasinopilosus]
MDTTQVEALIGMLAVLGLLVLMVLPAVIGIAHERRTDRQLKWAETGRAAAGRHHAPAGPPRPERTPGARPERSAAPHRTARAA